MSGKCYTDAKDAATPALEATATGASVIGSNSTAIAPLLRGIKTDGSGLLTVGVTNQDVVVTSNGVPLADSTGAGGYSLVAQESTATSHRIKRLLTGTNLNIASANSTLTLSAGYPGFARNTLPPTDSQTVDNITDSQDIFVGRIGLAGDLDVDGDRCRVRTGRRTQTVCALSTCART